MAIASTRSRSWAANVPAIVEEGKLPAGQVTASRNLVPAAIMVGVVGVTLLAMLLLLLVVLF